jgi:hypothetical protein
MHDVFTWSIHSKKSALEFATSREFRSDFFGSPIWYHVRTRVDPAIALSSARLKARLKATRGI